MGEQKVEKQRLKRYLKHEFSREDIEEFAAECARKLSDLEGEKLNKKEVVKTIDANIAALESQISKLARNVKDKYEFRNIDCESTINWTTGRFTVIRLDTEEVVEDRGLTPAEKQQSLGL